MSVSEGADVLTGFLARTTTEARAADARSATLAWQIISGVASMFASDTGSKGVSKDEYLRGMGLGRGARPVSESRARNIQVIERSKRFDGFLDRARRKGVAAVTEGHRRRVTR